jgi:hypothetical protein
MSPFSQGLDPAGNASCDCACDGPDGLSAGARDFYASYVTAPRAALLLAFAAGCVLVAVLAIVCLLSCALVELNRATAKLRADSVAEVRGGLLPQGGSPPADSKKPKRKAKKELTVHYDDSDDEEHRL